MGKYRVILFPVVTIGFLLAVAFTIASVIAGSSRPKPQRPTNPAGAAPASKAYVLSAGLWRTDGGFVSTIRIKNVLAVAALEVTPIIYMADGTPYLLSPVHVAISGVATVNINDALANAPISIAGHISQYGSAALMYSYPSPGHVSAHIRAIDTSRSLIFVFPFVEPMGDPKQQTLEGLWWKRDSGVSGFVSLTNTTDGDAEATVQLAGPGNGPQAPHKVALRPHSTQMFHLEDLADNPSPLTKRAGGVRVQYKGQPGSVLVTGGLENESEGYSANIPFWMRDMHSTTSTQITYGSAGIMVGKPDPMMMPGFPKETTFSPYLVLRNTTEKPLDVLLQLNYETGTAGNPAVTRSLPAQHLGPFEARQVDMQSALNSAGLKSFNGSINLAVSFTGKAGDLILASGSVDQTGTYVFGVDPEGVGAVRSKYASYWSTSDGNDTMFTLWNPTDSAQDVLVTFYYGDGSGEYKLPVHLAAQASAMIDMAMLIAESQPDADGHVIPTGMKEGSAQFSNPKGRAETITIVIADGIYNVATATCGGPGCVQCCGVSNFGVSPNPIYCPVGETMPCSTTAVDCNGWPVGPSSWGSSDTSVMTVDGSGDVTGVAPGSAAITAYYGNLIEYTGQFCGGPYCPSGAPAPSAQANVLPTISKDKELWYFGSGVPTPPGFTLGATTATLTANGAGNGTYVWTITNGISEAAFENSSSTITKTSVNTVGISSTSYSTTANDVTVQLQFTPSGGSQVTATISLSIDSPYKLTSAGSITNIGLVYGTCNNPQPGSDGYISYIPYDIESFFGVQMSNTPINEVFHERFDQWQGNNWPSPTAGRYTSPDGFFADQVCQTQPSGTPPSYPPSAPESSLVFQLAQDWYVGTLTNGSGLRVQEDDVEFYQNRGDHIGILSPVR